MKQTSKTKDINQLMKEADELIQKIETDAYGDWKEEQQFEFEKQASALRKYKAMMQDQTTSNSKQELNTGADGMHRAINEIVKSMHDLANKFF